MFEFRSTRFWKPGNTDGDIEAVGISRPTVFKVKATGIEKKVGRVQRTNPLGGPVEVDQGPRGRHRDPEDHVHPLAPANTARTTQAFLGQEMDFWAKDFPLDYAFWLHIESKACRLRHPNIAALKATVNQEWAGMDEDFVVKVYQALRKRFAIVATNGGYIE
ncbi:Putative transposable element [Caligus rogercresseyi]|uniref:Transposable element n=1 Tax=Caligus rogercresseyi TaxID=217165 RepID=A0A7T8HG08_CALRO|nr:Putative transposable element [Caligus rogercresseyi]